MKLTADQLWASESIMACNAELGLSMDKLVKLVRAVEETQRQLASPAEQQGAEPVAVPDWQFLLGVLEELRLPPKSDENRFFNVGLGRARDAVQEFIALERAHAAQASPTPAQAGAQERLSLTLTQARKLAEVLYDHKDEGPINSGWASPELEELRSIADEYVALLGTASPTPTTAEPKA